MEQEKHVVHFLMPQLSRPMVSSKQTESERAMNQTYVSLTNVSVVSKHSLRLNYFSER